MAFGIRGAGSPFHCDILVLVREYTREIRAVGALGSEEEKNLIEKSGHRAQGTILTSDTYPNS